ncbi:glycoside hydrolase family 32 protein [Deinococcus radiotolerans]|uniref:Levanase n=1 Tax=Deinococcus radiotolerans TaxID=1309407 RepID=A0ABQ2FL78_9DEIO|nr:glycoside hydrolase family 32 protein [Deinococcus radiotolerans]GGL03278.1 hypothetical protein GCM10010844_22360 [Deinococcus radiotolerans]
MAVLRPRVHFTARRFWLNDPNGLVFAGGRYHVFFQHNPRAGNHGYMSWGHASSVDLLRWEEHEVALPWREGQDVFSGSAVVDWRNTSGLGGAGDGGPPVVAMFTGNGFYHQAQYLAVSRDGGATWAFGPPEPVLDEGKQDFRDPKVFWYAPGEYWVSVVVHPDERQVGVYTSPDLRVWSQVSVFGPAGGVAGIWEVPDLFPLEVAGQERWVLKVDVFEGGPQGGTGAQYWVGDFDGRVFTPSQGARWADVGKDFYAAITFSDLPQPGRRVWLGWLNNWVYANHLSTQPWQGVLTLPRELSLVPDGPEWALAQVPVPELEALREEPLALPDGQRVEVGEGVPLDLTLPLTSWTLQLLSAGGEEARLWLDGGSLHLTRAAPQALEDFAGTFSAPLPDAVGEVRVLLDTCTLEVFAAGGRLAFTQLLLPHEPISALRLSGVVGRGWTLRPTQAP